MKNFINQINPIFIYEIILKVFADKEKNVIKVISFLKSL